MNAGPLEKDARDFLGDRSDSIPESVYLKAVTDLVRHLEKYRKSGSPETETPE